MARPKKITQETPVEAIQEQTNDEIVNEVVEIQQEIQSESEVISDEKIAFMKMVEDYKTQNPIKYELKKSVFEEKLKSL